MNNSQINEFHKPFIKSLVFIGLVTIVSMISVRYLVNFILTKHYSTPIYTSIESSKSQD